MNDIELGSMLVALFKATSVEKRQLKDGTFQKYREVYVPDGEPYIDPKNEKCPECDSQTISESGGGIKCTKCQWWFCF